MIEINALTIAKSNANPAGTPDKSPADDVEASIIVPTNTTINNIRNNLLHDSRNLPILIPILSQLGNIAGCLSINILYILYTRISDSGRQGKNTKNKHTR